jgi:hypothetical protein
LQILLEAAQGIDFFGGGGDASGLGDEEWLIAGPGENGRPGTGEARGSADAAKRVGGAVRGAGDEAEIAVALKGEKGACFGEGQKPDTERSQAIGGERECVGGQRCSLHFVAAEVFFVEIFQPAAQFFTLALFGSGGGDA